MTDMFRCEGKVRGAVFISDRSLDDDIVLYSALKPVLRPPNCCFDASAIDFVWSNVVCVALALCALRLLRRLSDLGQRRASDRRSSEDDGGGGCPLA